MYLSGTNSFNLGKGWKIDLSGRILNDQVASQLLIKGYWIVDLGVAKTILKGRGTIKFSGGDIFYSYRGSGIINNLAQTNADWNSTRTQEVYERLFHSDLVNQR